MKELRIIIAGSRGFEDYELLRKETLGVLKSDNRPKEFVKVLSGCARGADSLGEQFAAEFGLEVVRFPADWENLGKSAGFIRNVEMSKFAVEDGSDGMMIAFWDGRSKGTEHMIDTAGKYGLRVKVVYYG